MAFFFAQKSDHHRLTFFLIWHYSCIIDNILTIYTPTMKSNFLFKSSAFVATFWMLTSCQKPALMEAEPDKEYQSSIDVTFAATVISDVDMLCGFTAEGDNYPKFYKASSNSSGTYSASRDTLGKYVFMGFNNTTCADGRVRDGSIAMYYGATNPNAIYMRDFEFQGKVSLLNYRVDGWIVESGNTFVITNLLPSFAYNTEQTNLSWSIKGDFTLKHPSDNTKNIHCKVDLVKTLANTSDKNVFAPSRQSAINWELSVVEYKGTITGETANNTKFKYTINDANPLVRDFMCYPDKVAGITTSPVTTELEEFHPFTKGRVTLYTGELYPRDLSYGNEQDTYHDVKDAPLKLAAQCDNKGIVTIKGISYPIDFAKQYK